MNDNSARITWLDNLRAIGIFMVILGHMNLDNYVWQYLHSIAMPIFFFVSGYLFNQRNCGSFRQFFWKKCRTIIVPYLFFAILSFMFWFLVVRSLSISGKALSIDPFKAFIGVFYGVGSGVWKNPLNTALWFFPCLFVVEILYYWVRGRWYLLPVFALLGYWAGELPFRLPLGSDAALTGIVFFGVGQSYKDTWLRYRYIPILITFHLVFCFLNNRTDMNSLMYGNVFYYYISALSGVLLYSFLCKRLRPAGILSYIGSNTFIIIGMQGIVSFTMHSIHFVCFGARIQQSGLAFGCVLTILSICLSIPAVYLINAYVPLMLGRSKPAINKWAWLQPLYSTK